jgi:hypothetical protein
MVNVGDAFMAQALDENRSGRLADEQRRGWSGRSRGLRKSELNFAVIVTIIGLLVWLSPGPARYATVKPLVGVVALIIAAFLLLRALTGVDALTEDVRSGEVRSIDGAITKRSVSGSGRSNLTTRYFDVSGQRLQVDSSSWYAAAPEAGWVRVFYLPRSHKVVNLEVLQGPAVPDMTPATANQFTETLRTAAHSHNETQMAEARAFGKAMGDKFKQDLQKAAVPPPKERRDPRPLGQSIVGAWSNPFMSVEFARDGSVTATLPGGHKRTGRWSVGSDGKLHADALGQSQAADAWISDGQLTIALDNMGLSFRRVGSG